MQPKSVLKNRKSEFDVYLDDDENLHSETAEDSSHPNNTELCVESNVSVIAYHRKHMVYFNFKHAYDIMIDIMNMHIFHKHSVLENDCIEDFCYYWFLLNKYYKF